MFIGVGINDEQYSSLDVEMSSSIVEVMQAMEKNADGYGEINWKVHTIEIDGGYFFRGTTKDFENKFYVCEIFQVSKHSEAFLVSWHAYDGVDFRCDEFLEFDKALDAMTRRFKADRELYLGDTSEDMNYLGLDSTVLDTGIEWRMQQVVQNKLYEGGEE